MRALYQDVKKLCRLSIITGYQSEEVNTKAGRCFVGHWISVPTVRVPKFGNHKSFERLELNVRDASLGEYLQLFHE